MFYLEHPMATLSPDVTAAVASLQARWGAAAPRTAAATEGALALAPAPATAPASTLAPNPATAPASTPTLAPNPATAPASTPTRLAPTPDDRVIRTGFAALDAILGPGGLPRSASVAIRGDGSSGRTTLVLRLAAEAQAAGSIVAWLDLSRSFDPVEAVARGVRLEWLVVITPETLDEGLAIGGALLAGRSVDLLVLDLPGGRLARTDKPARIADRLGRLAALARRSEILFVILEPPGLAGGLATAVAESTALRLELVRRSWIRLGRDIVGQRTEALVARNRYGPPGRRATLRILYAEGGERDACLGRDDLLADELPTDAPARAPDPNPGQGPRPRPCEPERIHRDATPPSPPAAPPTRARPGASLRALPGGPAHPGRPAVGPGPGHRREPGRPGAGRPARDAARERTPARP
jgi:RecA/RadA recombinase